MIPYIWNSPIIIITISKIESHTAVKLGINKVYFSVVHAVSSFPVLLPVKISEFEKCYCLSGFGFGENDGVDHAGAGDQGSAVVLKAFLQCC